MYFNKIILSFITVITLCNCAGDNSLHSQQSSKKEVSIINGKGDRIITRFNDPEGYKRVTTKEGSFARYLQNLKLKPEGAAVLYYNGGRKSNNNVYTAVVDMPIGKRDLHQCADAIMRLRAEYLWLNKRYNDIHFNFTNGFRVDYSKWMNGKRIVVKGNRSYWIDKTGVDSSYKTFWQYMETIFMYAGTLSLSEELKHADANSMQIGDIFIQGGSPGHAVIVVDMAINKNTGDKLFMLAQSYMPAQEIQILTNKYNKAISPWYKLDFGNTLYTPEWTFNRTDLKRLTE